MQVDAVKQLADDMHQHLLELWQPCQVVAFNPAESPTASCIRTSEVVKDAECWTEVTTELVTGNQKQERAEPKPWVTGSLLPINPTAA